MFISRGLLFAGCVAIIHFPVRAQAQVQDATTPIARYCGLGLQGESQSFSKLNPDLGRIFADAKRRSEINNALFSATKASNWRVNLIGKDDAAGRGATLAFTYVLTYERIEPQKFVDPRDGAMKFNTSYSVGINTVLFDLDHGQVRSIVPAVVIFNNVTVNSPTAAQNFEAFSTIFRSIGEDDSAIGHWLKSIKQVPIQNDEKIYLRVAPVILSDEVKATLASAAESNSQTQGVFIRNLASQYESLLATTFGKSIVPSQIDEQGNIASGNQYTASLPDCSERPISLQMPTPAYEMHLYVDKLVTNSVDHTLESLPNLPSRGSLQTEVAYGGRFRTEVSEYVDSPTGDAGKVLDSQTFRFTRSIRFTGQRQIGTFDQYFKLSSNFVKELLSAYVQQDRKWIKDSLSASITDRAKRDDGKIAKDWKTLVAQRMTVTPLPKIADRQSKPAGGKGAT